MGCLNSPDFESNMEYIVDYVELFSEHCAKERVWLNFHLSEPLNRLFLKWTPSPIHWKKGLPSY